MWVVEPRRANEPHSEVSIGKRKRDVVTRLSDFVLRRGLRRSGFQHEPQSRGIVRFVTTHGALPCRSTQRRFDVVVRQDTVALPDRLAGHKGFATEEQRPDGRLQCFMQTIEERRLATQGDQKAGVGEVVPL